MSRLIPAAERILRARTLIQQARDLPVPAEGGRGDFSYVAQVKDLLDRRGTSSSSSPLRRVLLLR